MKRKKRWVLPRDPLVFSGYFLYLMFPDYVFLAIFTAPCMLLKNQTFSM